jgi:starch-binding outer membrane protein, SusD/RagB family
MKNIKLLSACFLIVSLFITSSCKKEFLETNPTNRVDASTTLKSIDNAKAALNGIHRNMYIRINNQGEFGFGTVMLNNDCLGEDYVFSGQSNGWFLTSYRWLMHRNSASSDLEYAYKYLYTMIANANVLINGVDGISGGSAGDKASIKGQALCYRAWAYHNLVQLYGKRFDKTTTNNNPGVPLLLTNSLAPTARATVADVYAQINIDLNAAETILATATSRGADKSNFNVNVVRGLQARVALTQQNWDVAATKAALARTGFTLMTALQQLDGYNSYDNTEWMWGSRQIDDQTEFFTAYFAYISCNYNSTNIRTNPKCISTSLYNTMALADVRRALWVPVPTVANSVTPPGGNRVAFMNQKFKAKGEANSVGDNPYMRAAEMFLIEAEARARNGQDGLAQTALFGLMSNRVPGSVMSSNTGAALITEIMNSRRVELWGEGFRFLDLKRLNSALDRNGSNHNTALALTMSVPAGDVTWEFVIPQTELNANPLCTQNP